MLELPFNRSANLAISLTRKHQKRPRACLKSLSLQRTRLFRCICKSLSPGAESAGAAHGCDQIAGDGGAG